MNIYQRMLKVMEAVDYVQKEQKKVNGQYTFVSHDAVTAKIRPELVKNGILAVARVVRHEQDGNRTEADVEVDFINADKPDERITIPCFGYGIDPQDKGPGKAISYAVKYAYLKAFALETGDDPERDNIEHKPASKVTPTAGARENLTPERLAVVEQTANQAITLLAQDKDFDAYSLLETSGFDAEEKIALWTYLDSKQRRRLKEQAELEKANQRKAA